MEQYSTKKDARTYSVISTETSSELELTLERVNSLAVGINSNLSNLLMANEYILQSILLDAYMGRAYECIYSNVNTNYKLNYPKIQDGDDSSVFESVKAEIENFNRFVGIENIIKDSISGTMREGNYTTYLRLTPGEGGTIASAVIDHYPLATCYPSDYYVNGDNVLEVDISTLKNRLKKTYKKSRKTRKELYYKDIKDEIEDVYPPEVYKAYKDGETYVKLDDLYSGCIKINSMGRKFGVSPFFKALRALIVLNNIEAADVADSKTRSKKVIFQKLRKELLGTNGEKKAFAEMEYAHQSAASALKTNFCLYTAPAFVEDLSYVVDDSTNDKASDSIKTYTSKLLTALGISFADSDLSSFTTATISVEQLMRTINSISEQLERILNKYYQIYLEAIGLPKELAPQIKIVDSELMEWGLRKEFAQFAYSTLNASRDTVFKLVGLDIEDEKIKRQAENDGLLDATFTPRPTAYNSQASENLGDNETSVGRPSTSDNKEQQALDKNYSKDART